MRHAILGPGGIGGLVGALLAQSGEAVSLIVRPASVSDYPHVLVAKNASREYSGPVSVAATLTEPVDVLWITVKATELPPALAGIPPDAEAGAVVPLLNGVDHIALLRGRFGEVKVVPATIAVESERIAPGQIAWRSPFAQLNLSSRGRAQLTATVALLSAFGWECRFVDDETSLMWGKLVFLAPLALATTAAAAPVGEVLARPPLRLELEQLAVEACAVAAASGAVVHQDQVLDRFQKIPAGMRSSMQKDVERGQPPELDAIAGPIVRGGQKYGIPVPTTQRLVQQIESRIKPKPAPKPSLG